MRRKAIRRKLDALMLKRMGIQPDCNTKGLRRNPTHEFRLANPTETQPVRDLNGTPDFNAGVDPKNLLQYPYPGVRK